MQRHLVQIASALAMLAAVSVAGSAATGDASARRGLTVIGQWCKTCHGVAGVETDANRAPTFATIVKRRGRGRAYLRRFLDQDHFPMPTFRLFDHEKEDVVAFLIWLKATE